MEHQWRILLVDDDLFQLGFLGSELARRGYRILTAENGLDALESIAADQIDIVITDIFMPDMDGIELIQHLRSRFPGTPIFALSGGATLAEPGLYLEFAKSLGADEVFAKPVEIAKLISKLAEYGS